MSWEATGWAREQRAGGVGPKVVLMVLAEHADEHGLSWPSTRTLAEEAECDQRTVRRHLDQLRSGGLVEWKPGVGRGSNRYQLIMPETAPRGSRRRSLVRRPGASQAAAVVRQSSASQGASETPRSEALDERSEALDLRSETTRPSDQQEREQNRATLEPRKIEPTAATQRYARVREHVSPAELNRTATRGGTAYGILASWVGRNPGVANGHRRALAKAVENLLAQGADPAHMPAALDAAHEPHWRNPAKALPMAYDDVRRAAAATAAPRKSTWNATDDNIRALLAGVERPATIRPAIGGTR